MNNTNYFILRNGKVAGPLDVQKLRSLFKEKRIQRGKLQIRIWAPGMMLQQ